MRIIAIANQKGGCGKTTTSINLASCLSYLGKEVLLIDFDPQGHATLGLGIRSEDYGKSVFDVIDFPEDNNPSLSDVAVKKNEYLDVVPADVVLSAIEQKLSGVPGRETRLLEKLTALKKNYEYIIIDCPPSLSLLTFNALMAAEELIVPLEPSSFSLHGLQKIFETVNLLKDGLGHELSVNALLTMFESRTRFARDFENQVNQAFEERVFQVKIRRTVRLREAAQVGQAIVELDKDSVGFQDYMNLACELIEKARTKVQESKREEPTEEEPTEEEPTPTPSSQLQVITRREISAATVFVVDLPEASSVQVAGDFNNWVASDLTLKDGASGRWEASVPLSQGRYRYKYLIDGQWRVDPRHDNVETNEYGTLDSVIEVQ